MLFSSIQAYFNPRTREGCDFYAFLCLPLVIVFQSTHPRGVRPFKDAKKLKTLDISIHAPARGATIHPSYQPRQGKDISIHAPARGATISSHFSPAFQDNFNPRTREGCDRPFVKLLLQGKHFNPRTREGCDIYDYEVTTTPDDFNPRTREGCDRWIMMIYHFKSYFNPRTREGCDNTVRLYVLNLLYISIHAPARGATIQLPHNRQNLPLFQSTHPRGVRLRQVVFAVNVANISIHAPARGATSYLQA